MIILIYHMNIFMLSLFNSLSYFNNEHETNTTYFIHERFSYLFKTFSFFWVFHVSFSPVSVSTSVHDPQNQKPEQYQKKLKSAFFFKVIFIV